VTKKTPFDELSDEEFVDRFRVPDDKIPTVTQPTLRRKKGYVPSYPLRIQLALKKAKVTANVVYLVMAIHRQMHMTKQNSIPLTGAVWDAAGCSSQKEKAAILRKLKQLPEIVGLSVKRTLYGYYRATKGPLWDQEDQE